MEELIQSCRFIICKLVNLQAYPRYHPGALKKLVAEPEGQTQNNPEHDFLSSDCGKEVDEDFSFCP